MPQECYRCAECLTETNRCEACRARRAEARQDLRRRRLEAGLCADCDRPAVVVKGKNGKPKRLTRCKLHRTLNAKWSGESHARRREAS